LQRRLGGVQPDISELEGVLDKGLNSAVDAEAGKSRYKLVGGRFRTRNSADAELNDASNRELKLVTSNRHIKRPFRCPRFDAAIKILIVLRRSEANQRRQAREGFDGFCDEICSSVEMIIIKLSGM
jgi:hypothetical protein